MGKMDNREAVELNKAENKHEKRAPLKKKNWKCLDISRMR